MRVGRANSPRRLHTAEHRAQQTARADRRMLRTSRLGHPSCCTQGVAFPRQGLARQRGRGSFRARARGDSRNAKGPRAVVLPLCMDRALSYMADTVGLFARPHHVALLLAVLSAAALIRIAIAYANRSVLFILKEHAGIDANELSWAQRAVRLPVAVL